MGESQYSQTMPDNSFPSCIAWVNCFWHSLEELVALQFTNWIANLPSFSGCMPINISYCCILSHFFCSFILALAYFIIMPVFSNSFYSLILSHSTTFPTWPGTANSFIWLYCIVYIYIYLCLSNSKICLAQLVHTLRIFEEGSIIFYGQSEWRNCSTLYFLDRFPSLKML